MAKKIISILFLVCFSFTLFCTTAAAVEESTAPENALEIVTEAESSVTDITEPVVEVSTTPVSEQTVVYEVPTEEYDPYEGLYAPQPAVENTQENWNTTIYFTGLSMEYTVIIKNIETGKKYNFNINKDNNWIATGLFEKGTYKIQSIRTDNASYRAGKVYNENNEKISTIEINGDNEHLQVIKLNIPEHVTFNIFTVIKRYWIFVALLSILGVVYFYLVKVKKVKVLK